MSGNRQNALSCLRCLLVNINRIIDPLYRSFIMIARRIDEVR